MLRRIVLRRILSTAFFVSAIGVFCGCKDVAKIVNDIGGFFAQICECRCICATQGEGLNGDFVCTTKTFPTCEQTCEGKSQTSGGSGSVLCTTAH
jgi:hypothetical protein